MDTSVWTKERIATLRKLHSAGKRAAEIAGQLGGGITRNAVIGKIHRLQLEAKTKRSQPTAKRSQPTAKKPNRPKQKSPVGRSDTAKTQRGTTSSNKPAGASVAKPKRVTGTRATATKGKPATAPQRLRQLAKASVKSAKPTGTRQPAVNAARKAKQVSGRSTAQKSKFTPGPQGSVSARASLRKPGQRPRAPGRSTAEKTTKAQASKAGTAKATVKNRRSSTSPKTTPTSNKRTSANVQGRREIATAPASRPASSSRQKKTSGRPRLKVRVSRPAKKPVAKPAKPRTRVRKVADTPARKPKSPDSPLGAARKHRGSTTETSAQPVPVKLGRRRTMASQSRGIQVVTKRAKEDGRGIKRRVGRPKGSKTNAPQLRQSTHRGTSARANSARRDSVNVASPSTVDLPPRMLRLTELTDRDCRWPIGDPHDPKFRFCGNPVAPRKVYCATHAELAYQPLTQRRERGKAK